MSSLRPPARQDKSLQEYEVLVTGAKGFLGSRLVSRLIADGATVTCTSRGDGPLAQNTEARWRVCELADARNVHDVLSDTKPQVVFHLAGKASGLREPENVLATLEANLIASVNVLLAALDSGVRRVVLAGSYEEPDADSAPRSPYAASKAGAALYARMFADLYGLSTVVLRPAMIYGPGQPDTAKLIPYVTRCFLSGEVPVLTSGRRAVDWVYVDDVVEAFLAAAITPAIDGEVIDIGSGELHTISEIVETLAVATRAKQRAQFGGVADRPAEHIGAADTEKARGLLGWTSTTPLSVGLERTVQGVRSVLQADDSKAGPSA